MNSPNEQDIAKRAYAIWEQEGRPNGRSVEHWLTAERELSAARKAIEESFASDSPSPAVGEKKRAAAGQGAKPKVSILKPKSRSRATPISKPH